jgi:hypothetical protein
MHGDLYIWNTKFSLDALCTWTEGVADLDALAKTNPISVYDLCHYNVLTPVSRLL